MIQLNQKQQAFVERFYKSLTIGKQHNHLSVSEFIGNLCDENSLKAEVIVIIYREFIKNTEGNNKFEAFKRSLEGIKANNLDNVIGFKIAEISQPGMTSKPQVLIVYNMRYFEKKHISNIPIRIAEQMYNKVRQEDERAKQMSKHRFLNNKLFSRLNAPLYELTLNLVEYSV